MAHKKIYDSSTYIELTLQALRQHPGNIALSDGKDTITYRQLEERIYRFAHALQAQELQPGEGLAQLSYNRIDCFVTMSAALLLGLRYTPLHPMGSLEDHTYILEDAEITALVIDEQGFAKRGADLEHAYPALRELFTLGAADFGNDLTQLSENSEASRIVPSVEAEDIAWITYTGGTTGRPKGVIWSHRTMAVNAVISMANWQWPREVRLLAGGPLSHGAGTAVLPVLMKGGTVYMAQGFDPERFLKTVEQHRITMTMLVPTMIYVLMDHPLIKEVDISSLETINYASSPISPARLKDALDIFGPVMMQIYGQTEAINISMLKKQDHDLERPERLASCGIPMAGIQLALLDGEGKPVPQGEVGEICVRGPHLMDGYWKLPEENEKVFKHDWLHTGDMAVEDENGYLYMVDRAKDMIISGGFNVYPKEIEDVLTAHAQVADAVVIGVPDEKWGEAVVAIVVPKAVETLDNDELIALVKEKKGPVYAPKRIEIADSIPLTPIGKPDKKALKKQYWGEQERMVN